MLIEDSCTMELAPDRCENENVYCEPGITKPRKQFSKRQPYYAMARNVLRYIDLSNEDKDVTHNITLLDADERDNIKAYVLTTSGVSDTEVQASQMEGLHLVPSFFRIASFPIVQSENMEFVPGLKDHAAQRAREAIRRQEDRKLISLLDGTIDRQSDEWKNDHLFTEFEVTQKGFDRAVGIIKSAEVPVRGLLVNPLASYYFSDVDFYRNGHYISLWENVNVPANNAYLITSPDYLGALISLYGIKEKENAMTEQFREGLVLDELISMMILNPDGIVRFEL